MGAIERFVAAALRQRLDLLVRFSHYCLTTKVTKVTKVEKR